VNWSALFIYRPVATVLLTAAITLAGMLAFSLLPISSLPQVDFPNLGLQVMLPGASPETMASSVATPLERALGRIAGITEMTSSSTQGSTRINLQFDLDRDIDGAARDVQSAINAARSMLPSNLPANPTYRKSNAAGGPIIAIALTSDSYTKEQLYDVAFTILGQKIAQVKGVGQVNVNGSALPSVRVEANPTALARYGISFEQLRTALTAANANLPKGSIEQGAQRWQIQANDQLKNASDFRNIVVTYHNGAAVFLRDVAVVSNGVQDFRNAGSANGKASVMIAVMNQPGSNVVEAVDAIRALLPQLRASMPADVDVQVVIDRTTTIRATLREVEHTLLISIALVILVVFLFLRDVRATLIPAVAIPVSLFGTLAVIYVCGYSLNNLSLMALIIATGFVVDDAIVVVENVTRHIEKGVEPFAAALIGAREVGFTVLSMSASLIAVFIPLLLMGGIIGRLFREFAVTLSVAVVVSLIVSLTTTPMMCARLLRHAARKPRPRDFSERVARVFAPIGRGYQHSLAWALRHGPLMLLVFFAAVAFNVYLFVQIPKGFFPQQDTGRLQGFLQADQSTSFASMRQKIQKLMKIVGEDPAIETYYEYTGGFGGGQNNTGSMFALLKPRDERDSAADVVARLRPKLAKVPGGNLFLSPQQDINIGGRPGGGLYQYTLLGSDLDELREWAPKLKTALAKLPVLTDLNSDMQDGGLQTSLHVDRDTASRLGIAARDIDATLNDAYGQRLVSTIYEPLNQYYVVLTMPPEFVSSPAMLEHMHVKSTNSSNGNGAMVPLAAFSRYDNTNAPLAVNHQGQFAAATLSFNLAPGISLSHATQAIQSVFAQLGVPASVRGTFAGTAQVFQASLDSQPWLILAAVVTTYIVLGILYESFVHPLTILSTLPSAGIGALLALMAFNTELSIIALIGIFLLIGIVMKNAILMIDFAVQLEREQSLQPLLAIHRAACLRFRPIMMTTLAALLGALPLALALGDGSELRRPLGISIVGGLVVSQLLTLYTTPVIYLYLDRLRLHVLALRRRFSVATP